MFEHLISLVRKEEVTLFIGAGFSLEAHAPSVAMLKQAILNEISKEGQNGHSNDGLDELSEYFVEEECTGSRVQLVQILKNLFTSFKPTSLSDHIALTKIPHFHKIFTTNYDTLLEDSYSVDDCQVVRTDKDCSTMENKPVTIFKIHGDFTDPDSLVITTQDYKDLLAQKRNKEMWKLVEGEFLTKNIAFIGYSLEDDNILKLIERISKAVGKEQRQMFLIAPSISESRKKELKKKHIQYYKAYASEFLKELNKDLANNVTSDYQQHLISSETYSRFMNLHNIMVSLIPKKEEDNIVGQIFPSEGNTLNRTLSFTVNNENKEKIENRDFEKDGIFLSDSPFPYLPVIPITCLGSYWVNDVRMKGDIKKVFIGPSVKDINLTFIIPQRNFIETVKATGYNLRKGKFVLKFDGESYKAQMEITYQGQRNFNLQVDFDPKTVYHDNNRALRMIDIPDALFSKEKVLLSGLFGDTINISNFKGEIVDNNFHNLKMYYDNINNIEINSGIKFNIYNKCTEDAYIASIQLRAFYENKKIIPSTPEGQNFQIKVRPNSAFANGWDEKKKVSLIISNDNNQHITLNERDFVIPFVYEVYASCTVRVHKDASSVADVFNEPNCYYKVLSTKPVKEAFPNENWL